MSAPTLTHQPIDELRHRFISNHRLMIDETPRKFVATESAQAPPAAQALLGIAGIAEVVLEGNSATVVRDPDGPSWPDLVPRIDYALTATFTPQGAPTPSTSSSATTASTGNLDDDDIYEQVEQIFREQINPIVAQHGGAIDLIDVQDATVIVRMTGGCQGCGMANVTLKQGIQAALERAIPNLNGLRDVTDHASGQNPYFASTGK